MDKKMIRVSCIVSRIYSRFLDKKNKIDKDKIIGIGKKVLSDEDIKMLRRILNKLPNEEYVENAHEN